MNVCAGGAKAKLLLELALHRNLLHPFDAEGELGVRAGIAGTHETPEPRDQANLVRFHLVVRTVQSHQPDDRQPDICQRPPRLAQPGSCFACETREFFWIKTNALACHDTFSQSLAENSTSG